MVVAPDKLTDLIRHSDQSQPLKRRPRKLEASPQYLRKMSLQPLFLLGDRRAAPILEFQRGLYLAEYGLQRLIQLFPNESRAQDRVALHHLPPGLLERHDVQVSLDRVPETFDIHSRLLGVEIVKEHPLL